MTQLENAFYSKPGQHQGASALRAWSPTPTGARHIGMIFGSKRVMPVVEVRLADELDVTELLVDESVFLRTAPLIDKLRDRTLSRRRYGQLVAVLTENAMKTPPDETRRVLAAVDRRWKTCPAAHIPDIFAPVRRFLAHINPTAWRK